MFLITLMHHQPYWKAQIINEFNLTKMASRLKAKPNPPKPPNYTTLLSWFEGPNHSIYTMTDCHVEKCLHHYIKCKLPDFAGGHILCSQWLNELNSPGSTLHKSGAATQIEKQVINLYHWLQRLLFSFILVTFMMMI